MISRLFAASVLLLAACSDPAPSPPSEPAPDTVAPELSEIVVTPPAGRKGTAIDLSFKSTEPIAKATVTLNGRAMACLSPEGDTTRCGYTLQGDESEGSQSILIRAADAAGNEAKASAKVLVDFTAPTLTVTRQPAEPSNEKNPAFEFTVTEDAAVTCALDASAPAACTSPKQFQGVGHGPHVFHLFGKDAVGNEAELKVAFTLDLDAPDTTLVTVPPPASKQVDATLEFTSNDPRVTYECRLDAAAFAPCVSPAELQGLAEGTHTFEVRAVDAVGNPDPTPAKATFAVDLTAPTTTITPPVDDGKPARAIAFSANEAGSTFECALDGAAFATCTSPQSLTGLADGTHTFEVRATDKVGNLEQTAASVSVLVDTTPPSTTIIAGPPSPSLTSTVSFNFTASEPSSTFECRMDAGSWAVCTAPKSFTLSTDGSHTFEVRAKDRFGNQDATPATQTFLVDALPPTVTVTQAPTVTNQTTVAIDFQGNKANLTFACKVDQGAAAACTSPASLPGLGDGAHTFEVVATDSANRTSPAATVTFTVDTAKPVVTFQAQPQALSNATSAHFEFSGGEAGLSYECQLDAAAFAACTSPANVPVTDGAHTYSVRATDPAGNVSDLAVATFTSDLTAPQAPVVQQPDPSLTFNSTPTLTWSAVTDAASYSAELSLVPGFGTTEQTKAATTDLFMVPTTLNAGRYYFRVKATDAAGNASAWSATVVVEVRTWSFLMPRPQGATILASACTDATHCWFVGEAGLATRTSDGGATFLQASTGVLGNLYGVAALDATTLVAVGDNGALLRSEDGGVTFWPLASGVTTTLRAVKFRGTTGFAVGDTGTALKSTDSGKTWSRLTVSTASNPPSLRGLAIVTDAAASAGYTLVAVGGTGAVLRSEDAGSTWTAFPSGTTALLNAVTMVDASVGYAVGAYAADSSTLSVNVRKTTDGGKTWAGFKNGTQALYDVTFTDALTGWALGDSTSSLSPLRKTTDGGTTWSDVTLPSAAPLRTFAAASSTSWWVAGESGIVLSSASSGATFALASGLAAMPASESARDIRAIACASATSCLAVGGSGFAQRVDPTAANPFTALPATVITSTKQLYGVTFADATTAFTAGDSLIVKIDLTANTTTAVTPTGTNSFRNIHFSSPAVGVAVGTSGKVFVWDGTGAFVAGSVTDSAGTAITSSFRDVKALSATTGFIVGDNGVIARRDATGAFKTEPSSTTKDLYGVWAFDADNAVAVGLGGTILKRTAAGWANVTSGTALDLKAVSFADANNGWAVGNGLILVTTNGGTSWTKQTSPTGSTLLGVAAPSSTSVFAVGAARTVLYTSVGGR